MGNLIQDRVSKTHPMYQAAKEIEDAAIKHVQAQQRILLELGKIMQYRLPDGSALANNKANGEMLDEWLIPFTFEFFKQLVAEEKFRNMFSWTKPPAPPVPAGELRNRFSQACDQIQRMANSDANFYLTKSILGDFTVDEVVQASHDERLVGVTPASPQEHQRWRDKAVQDHQHYMKTQATKQELSEISKVEAETQRLTAAEEQLTRELEAGYLRDNYKPELPQMWAGQQMSARLLKSLSGDELRAMSKKHGSWRMTALLYGFRRREDGTWVKGN